MRYLTALLWLPLIAIKFTLALVGLVITLLTVSVWGEQSKDWPKVFWLWGNDEEGFPQWAKVQGHTAWWWYAVRNPVNNFRYLFKDTDDYYEKGNWSDDLPMEAKQIQEKALKRAWRFRQAGWKSGLRVVWLNGTTKYSEFWIGWKLGSNVPGLGFTIQLRLKRKIGT